MIKTYRLLFWFYYLYKIDFSTIGPMLLKQTELKITVAMIREQKVTSKEN